MQGGFDRQSGGGYFDPSHLHADYAVMFATWYEQSIRGDVELYAGQQITKRFGRRQRDNVLGVTSRLAVDVTDWLTAEMELEGGNFQLQTSDGFTYYLFTMNLIAFF